MFPNPQDACPLPPHPNLEQYKKLAKDLVKVCRAGGDMLPWAEDIFGKRGAKKVAEFAHRKMTEGGRKCALADARFVIARSYGFLSWPKFAKHIEGLANASSKTARFEAAADAIVKGDEATLKRLLSEDPALIRERSPRQHRATLLIYAAANGVENYRQMTPPNIVEIAKILLDAGAEVDAGADVYGGDWTTLGLAATSVHPDRAGVQNELMQLLIDHGAEIDRPSSAGRSDSILLACFANGRPSAAAYLAKKGARVDLLAAAALGWTDEVKKLLARGVGKEELNRAFFWACQYANVETVRLLVESGAEVGPHEPDKQSPIHMAVVGGNVGVVKYLLQFHPPLEVRNEYGGTVLGQALWSAAHGGDPEEYAEIIEALIAAGGQVRPKHPPVTPRIDELLRRYGSEPEPSWHWLSDEE